MTDQRVRSRQVKQAKSDADGSQGFSATMQGGLTNCVQQWTYNRDGQVLTAKVPLNNTTTADRTLGDLQSFTNAKNQVTDYTKYKKHGPLLESTDPNGVPTTNTYDLRQRLLSTNGGGQATSYENDPAGQLQKVTQRDQNWIGYEYDAAHRQVAVKDNLGNRIEYVLDNAGNRTSQRVKDPGGNLARSCPKHRCAGASPTDNGKGVKMSRAMQEIRWCGPVEAPIGQQSLSQLPPVPIANQYDAQTNPDKATVVLGDIQAIIAKALALLVFLLAEPVWAGPTYDANCIQEGGTTFVCFPSTLIAWFRPWRDGYITSGTINGVWDSYLAELDAQQNASPDLHQASVRTSDCSVLPISPVIDPVIYPYSAQWGLDGIWTASPKIWNGTYYTPNCFRETTYHDLIQNRTWTETKPLYGSNAASAPWFHTNCPRAYDSGDGRIDGLYCVVPVDIFKSLGKPECEDSAGNPINVKIANKHQIELDYRASSRGLQFARFYNSLVGTSDSNLGAWTHSYSSKIVRTFGSTRVIALAFRDDGKMSTFVRNGMGQYVSDPDVNDRLIELLGSGGTTSGWRYHDIDGGVIEEYDASGRLLFTTRNDGAGLALSYDDSGLTAITDAFGRRIAFTRNQGGNISGFLDASDSYASYSYDQYGNLKSISYSDGSSRSYLYDSAIRLVGIVDENARQFATFRYSDTREVASTEHAGGVDKYTLTLNPVTLVDPNGATSTRVYQYFNNVGRLASQSQPAGSGCAASTETISRDVNGNKTVVDDFTHKRTCSAYDLTRNLQTTRVEGLANTQACSAVTGAGATLPTGSRKVSTAWHPDWRLEAKRAEPGKMTTSVYNGQPDPLNGNAIASCAPSTALLPDGKPIAVLCKQVEQATSDADGSQGFGASLQMGVADRVKQWTYNAFGQVLTAKDSLNNTTTYTYYAATTAEHTLGDLQSVTNAKNQVTNFTKYNKHGQLLESIDANGVTTTNTYDLRQRLLSASVGGQTTNYEYDPAGQLLKVTRPDQSWIGYEYDAAHRQIAVKDNLGNRIEYVLDNAGNRTSQSVKDPGGNLARSLARSIDALGRVQQTTGRE